MSEDNMLTRESYDDVMQYNLAVMQQDNLALRSQIVGLNETIQALVKVDIEKSQRINELNIQIADAKNSEIVEAAHAQTAAMEKIGSVLEAMLAKPAQPVSLFNPTPPYVSTTTYGPLPK